MGRRYRRFSASELEILWSRWKEGQSNLQIAEALCAHPSSVWWQIQRRGGLPPQPRRRAERTLSLSEREEISRGLARAEGVRSLARRLVIIPWTLRLGWFSQKL